jgi:hypothetical protein
MRNDFATFILTHGRADNVLTYNSLRKNGYTGRIYLLVDDKDKQIDKYTENYGDEVIVFNKDEAVAMTDACDNYKRHNSVVFARNYNFVVARQLGIKYFWQLDDDYTEFRWAFGNDREYVTTADKFKLFSLDAVLDACVDFLVASDATSVAFAQGGDFIGGPMSAVAKHWAVSGWFSRKAMNSFLFDADKPVTFRGRVNDDVNLYVECGRRGELFVTIPRLRVMQPETQKNSGGCTDIYLEMGTYIKSFYSILVAPSCVKIATMGVTHRRIHHAVQWKYACPKILHSKYRKPRVA